MRVLLFQTAFLGDLVLSTPVIAGIKHLYPDCELHITTTPAGADLVRFHPQVASVIPFHKREQGGANQYLAQIKAMKFDRVYSLHKSPRTAITLYRAKIPTRVGFRGGIFTRLYSEHVQYRKEQHAVERSLEILGTSIPDELKEMCVYLAPTSEEILQRHNLIPKGYIAIAPGSVWKTKQWSEERYKQLVVLLEHQKQQVVLVGAKNEMALCDRIQHGTHAINLAGKSNLLELAAVIKNAKVLVCNDSLALHLGSAFKVPTVVNFCATAPAFGFGPWRNRHIIAEDNGLLCRPCARHGSNNCPTGTELCRTSVSAMSVFQYCLELDVNN